MTSQVHKFPHAGYRSEALIHVEGSPKPVEGEEGRDYRIPDLGGYFHSKLHI